MNFYTNSLDNIKNILEEYGVCVINNFFSDEECDMWFNNLKNWLINLDIGLTNDPKTWKLKNMPLGPRYGIYQSIITHAPDFFKIRRRMKPIFARLWDTDDLICTLDGASIYPFKLDKGIRWPHIDQTVPGKLCYQSQAVLTTTSASFMCTPGSHKDHDELLKKITPKIKNWYRFDLSNNSSENGNSLIDMTKHIPINVNKGSVILWDSRTIHSAKNHDAFQVKNTDALNLAPWRCVLYVCMRPRSTYTKRNLTTIKNALIQGRTTNHWGNKTFGTSTYQTSRLEKVNALLNNLETISLYNRSPDDGGLTEEEKKLFI